MILEKVVIKNFMRIVEAELDFSDKTIVGIRAVGIDDPERSNYLGKTSLIEAIQYCITGKSRADKEIELIHDGEEVMEVTTIWKDVNGNSHKIRRGRDIKNNGLIEVGFADKGREPQEAIDDLFGISSEDFEQIFYFKQQEIHDFMNETADKKKKKLMKWLKNDHWRDREQRVSDDVKAKKTEILEKQIIVKNAELEVGDEQLILDEYGSYKLKLEVYSKDLGALKKTLEKSKVKMTLDDFNTLQSQFKKTGEKISSMRSKIATRNEKKGELASLTVPEKYSTIETAYEDRKKYQDGKLKLREAQTILKANNEALAFKLTSLKQHKGVCPVLKEACDRIKAEGSEEAIKSDIDRNLEKIKEADAKIEACDNQLNNLDIIVRKLEGRRRIQTYLDDTAGYEAELQALIDLANALEQEMEDYDSERNDLVETLKAEIQQTEEQITRINRVLGGLEEKISKIEDNKELLAKTRTSIIDLNTELGDLQYLAFMFGKNGIPSLEIENAFTEIEEDVNFILEQINPAIKVTIRPDKELQAWEPNCPTCGYGFPKGYRKTSCEQCDTPRMKKRKDELTFVVLDNGKERSFKMCSGGLKTVISLAVRVALSLLVRRQNKTNFSTIFLDEIDSALDAIHREQIKDLVVRVLVNQLGFSQVVWISHDKTISQSVPHTILVKGYESYSELEWV